MKKIATILSMLLSLSSCIENNLPYPRIVPVILGMEVEGAVSVDISSATSTVEVALEETADIRSVVIRSIRFGDSMTSSDPPLKGTFDLSEPLNFTLTTYQEYRWTLAARQNISRFFTVQGQIGSSFIDVANRRAVAYVAPGVVLSRVTVLSCKLGPEGAQYSRNVLEVKDFRHPVEVDLTIHGRTEAWTVHVEHGDSSVSLTSVDPWTRVAWLAASGIAGQYNGFRWRRSGDAGWNVLSGDDLTEAGGSFRGCIVGLDPETEYECTAFSGDSETEVWTFVTGPETQLPNCGFEVRSKAESQNYWSWYDPSSQLWNAKWWDSGNAGSTTVGASASICTPDLADFAEGQCSARLNSRYVVIKFAAGNLFSGSFAGLVGTSGGMVDFGRPFTERPRSMTLSLKYICGAIDNVNGAPDGVTVAAGDPDRCQVFVALGDWDFRRCGGSRESPVRVNTTRKETFFDPHGEGVIAYGSFISDRSTGGWVRVEIPLEYRSVSRVPSHIIVSCAASMFGDYFTGSSSSVLWVDDIRLEY